VFIAGSLNATERQSSANCTFGSRSTSLSQGSKTFELPEVSKNVGILAHRNFAHDSLFLDISKLRFV